MTEALPPEEEGGDPPCWAAQFAELDDEDVGDEPDEGRGQST